MLEQPVCVPVWLSPAEQAAWFEELWNGVTALQERYPLVRSLARGAWWEQAGACELLASLCAWRAGLDELHAQLAGAPEERAQAEWAFHQRLPGLVQGLRWHRAGSDLRRELRGEPREAFDRFVRELRNRSSPAG
jgi:hypothetical protein